MNPWDVLAKQITRLNDRINLLPSIREATVTDLSPLAVTFDTDTAGTGVFATLTGGLLVGDRVLTVRLSRYVWVLGVRGVGDTGWVDIAGSVTPGSGWSFPSGLYARRVGSLVSIECPTAAAASSTFTVPVSGNITNQTICTGVPAQFRPGRAQGLGAGGTGRGHGIHISASGNITLPWVVPSATQTGDVANSAEEFSFGSTFLGG